MDLFFRFHFRLAGAGDLQRGSGMNSIGDLLAGKIRVQDPGVIFSGLLQDLQVRQPARDAIVNLPVDPELLDGRIELETSGRNQEVQQFFQGNSFDELRTAAAEFQDPGKDPFPGSNDDPAGGDFEHEEMPCRGDP